MMVKEHQQMIQELQRVAGTRGATSKSDSPSSGATRTPSSAEPNSDAQPRRGNASGQGGVPGQGNSANPSGPIDQVVGEVQVVV